MDTLRLTTYKTQEGTLQFAGRIEVSPPEILRFAEEDKRTPVDWMRPSVEFFDHLFCVQRGVAQSLCPVHLTGKHVLVKSHHQFLRFLVRHGPEAHHQALCADLQESAAQAINAFADLHVA